MGGAKSPSVQTFYLERLYPQFGNPVASTAGFHAKRSPHPFSLYNISFIIFFEQYII